MKESVLATQALCKKYAGGMAVDHVNMTVQKGDVYGFIGQNGAGKTTLIRLVTSLIFPTSGDIALFGRSDREGLAEARKRIGCIVEGPVFFPKMTAQQNLEYYRIQRGIPDTAAINKALETVRLIDTGKKKYKDFSLGMKQRLGLALAIMGHPDFLILDEPINGLDPMGIIEFRAIIKELSQTHGMTVLISSHILSELTQIATTFGIIHKGRLVKEFSQTQLEEETKRCIQIKVDDGATATAVLQEKLGTTAFEVLPNHEIRLYDFIDNPSEVIFQLSTNSVRVLSSTELGVNLEDYFLSVIGENPAGRNQ
jgi:ABC-2 type transport system ATP-binding protein